jgi:mannose-6-phosphate isomerase-like protein (cupin superfamily)
VPDLLEKNFVGSQPRRETVLSCSVNTRSMMIQLNAALPERLYENADATYYVIGGEGVVRIAGRETKLATNGFVSIPRGTSHAFVRSGRRPLILLAVLGGEACEEAK